MAVPLDNVPVTVGLCLTATEIFGRPTGFRECSAILSRLDFRSVAFHLAFIRQSTHSYFGNEPIRTNADLQDYGRLLQLVLSRERAEIALRQAAELSKTRDFHAFSDQSVIATLELAAQCCPRAGGVEVASGPDRDDLGRVLFSFHGAMFSPGFLRAARTADAWNQVTEKALSEVIRNNVANNDLGSEGRAIARLYAFATVPEIHEHFLKRTGETLDAWFQRRLGMSFFAYMRAAVIIGAASSRCNRETRQFSDLAVIESRLLDCLGEDDRNAATILLSLAKLPASRFVDAAPENLTDFQYQAQAFRMRPILDLGDCLLPTSGHAVTEKFIVGLPHVFDEAARQRDTKVDVAKVRLKFGYVFERYLGYLIDSWLHAHPGVEVLVDLKPPDNATDWDAVIVRGDTACLFEVKAKVFLLNIRRDGGFEYLDVMLLEALAKARLQAERLLEFAKCAAAPKSLGQVKRIVPALVIFDRVPLRYPYLDPYEKHVETKLEKTIFSAPGPNFAPLQTFEIDGVELWEQLIDLTPGSNEIFSYLEKRALDPLTRHNRKFPPRGDGSPQRTPSGPMFDALQRSRELLEELKKTIRFDQT